MVALLYVTFRAWGRSCYSGPRRAGPVHLDHSTSQSSSACLAQPFPLISIDHIRGDFNVSNDDSEVEGLLLAIIVSSGRAVVAIASAFRLPSGSPEARHHGHPRGTSVIIVIPSADKSKILNPPETLPPLHLRHLTLIDIALPKRSRLLTTAMGCSY